MRTAVAVFLLAVSLDAGAQTRPPAGTAKTNWTADQYGDPRDADLASIAGGGGRSKEHVRTRGRLEMHNRPGYFILADGGARVLVLPGRGVDPGEGLKMVGLHVEARGIVREIRPKQYVNGIDLDLIEDPDLPVLPAPAVDLPQMSLTLFSIFDMEERGRERADPAAHTPISELLIAPERFLGKAVRVLAQFRGQNLFDDLPKETQRGPNDWVVRDAAGGAAWVLDQKPRGKGWALDPAYKSDSSRWLEVVGKPEVANGVVYLHAAKVTLTTAPKTPHDPQQ